MEAHTEAPPIVGITPPIDTPTGRGRSLQNLKRHPKGTRPPQLRSGRIGPNKQTLESLIRRVLQARSHELLEELARAIIEGAIEREPACLAFLGPRLWPLLAENPNTGRVVFEGIKLEVTKEGASITLAQGANTPLTLPEGEEREVELEGSEGSEVSSIE